MINQDHQLVIATEQGQCVWDLCIELYGSVAALTILLKDNPEIAINTAIPPGTFVRYQPNLSGITDTDKETMSYLRDNGIRINTHFVDTIDSNYLLQEDSNHLLQEDNLSLIT